MSNTAPIADIALRWLRWWAIDCWLTAQHQWREAEFYRLGDQQLILLARTHHRLFCERLQLSPLIAPVDPVLLQLLLLPAAQRELALRLEAEVCWRGSTQATLLPEQQRWCRRIAQAMRPGLWLPVTLGIPTPCADVNGLWLLRQRSGAQCWPRVRLAFPKDRVLIVEQLPMMADFPQRLLPLWQAAVWYAAQESLC